MNKKVNGYSKYYGDSRYEKVWEQMQLLGIDDVSTNRQDKNGTITWRLPIKNKWDNGSFIEVGSFASGYVRNNNSCYSNYQLNKRRESEPQYYKDCKWNEDFTKQIWSGKYNMYTTRECILMPIEIDRLEYLISYCLKNYYIKHANFVSNGNYVPKWRHESELNELNDKLDSEHVKYKKLDYFYETSADFNKSMDEGMKDRIRDLEDKLDKANKTLLGDCKYIYPEGRYDKIKDLESDVYTQQQRGDGYKEGYENEKMIARGFSHKIKELEEKLENMTEARDYYKNSCDDFVDGGEDRIKDLENKLDKIKTFLKHEL